MFTGIVQTTATVTQFESQKGTWRLGINCPSSFLNNLQTGVSIAIDGTCLTVVDFDGTHAYFDLIAETLTRTSLKALTVGEKVNLERAAKCGDEIGGHLLSGHIHTTAIIKHIDQRNQQYILTCQVEPHWLPYIFPKGYIALSGVSLTVVDVDTKTATFTVHLIPETLRITHLGEKQAGYLLNIEIDQQTQAIVDTVTTYIEHPNFS